MERIQLVMEEVNGISTDKTEEQNGSMEGREHKDHRIKYPVKTIYRNVLHKDIIMTVRTRKLCGWQ